MVEYTGWDSHIVTDTNINTKLNFILTNRQHIPHDRFHWVRRILKDDSYNIALDGWNSHNMLTKKMLIHKIEIMILIVGYLMSINPGIIPVRVNVSVYGNQTES